MFFFCFAFFHCCLEIVREKRGVRGDQGEDAWSIKHDNVRIKLRIIIRFPVNPNITLSLSIRGF